MAFETTESGILIPKNYEIYVKPTEFQISERKLEGYKKLAEIKQFGIKYPTKFMKEFIGVELLDAQEYTFMNSWTKPFVLWLESRAAGKMLDLNTRIPTPNGDKTMGDLKLGDMVFDEQGKPTKVIYLSPINYQIRIHGKHIKKNGYQDIFSWRRGFGDYRYRGGSRREKENRREGTLERKCPPLRK